MTATSTTPTHDVGEDSRAFTPGGHGDEIVMIHEWRTSWWLVGVRLVYDEH
jgi:hypothetical protein